MSETGRGNWRGLAAIGLLVVGAATVVLTWPDPVAKQRSVELPQAPAAPLSPPPLQKLDRAALIDAAALAASAYAAGNLTDAKFEEFTGRRFELVLPFGCSGPAAREEKLERGWRYDAKSGIFQAAFPSNIVVSGKGEAAADVEAEPVTEFAKSFWIEREWLRQGICPAVPDAPLSTNPAEPKSLAIAEIASEERPRSDDRDGAPYRVSKRMAAEQLPDKNGLKLILTGRLASDQKIPFQCTSVDPNQRPICVILARFDKMQIKNAAGSEIYGEWAG